MTKIIHVMLAIFADIGAIYGSWVGIVNHRYLEGCFWIVWALWVKPGKDDLE